MKANNPFLVTLLVAVLAVGWGVWWLKVNVFPTYPSYPYHVRLTLEVDTPEGVKSTSGVLSFTIGSFKDLNGGGRTLRTTVTGEALFLDLPGGRNVVMLLAHGPTGEYVDAIKGLPELVIPPPRIAILDYLDKGGVLAGSRELAPPSIPTLVTFTDIKDPASAKVLYATGMRGVGPISPGGAYGYYEPTVLVDAFAETFGPGYAFRRATVEIVPLDTPVTRGIEAKLPFLVTHREKLRTQRTAPADPYIAQFGQFIRGSQP